MSLLRKPAVALGAAVPFGFLLAFAVEPLGQQAVGSFFTWYRLRPSSFAGLRYYRLVFEDPLARASLLHTTLYVAISVPLEIALGVWGAWHVSRSRRGGALWTTVYSLPLLIPWAAAATLFLGFFSAGGVLDGLRAHLFGLHAPVLWFQNQTLAFAVLVAFGVWKGAPWCFLLMLAAFATAPREVLEAGRMDGASGLAYWRSIALPAVWPMLVFVSVFRVFSEAQTFQGVQYLTQGGPYGSTQLVPSYASELAFHFFQFPESAALATLVGAVLVAAAAAGFALLHRPPHGLGGGPWWSRGPTGRRPSSLLWERRRRLVGLAVLAVLVAAPLLGGLPGGALAPSRGLAWSTVRTGLVNSAILTAATVAGVLVLALPAAYVLACSKARGRGALFLLVLVAMAIPGALVLLPEYQWLSWLGLLNTRLGLALLYVAADVPLATFFLRAAFAAVPGELVESMQVDGASRWAIARRLLVPLSSSTVVTVTVFVVVGVWNESLLALVMVSSRSLATLPALVAGGFGGTGSLGAAWLSVLPPLAVFVASQRVFRRGMSPGALL